MNRDAEHTPTGYKDAASVVVNQAPAPSSLAGGEVLTDADLASEALNLAGDLSSGHFAISDAISMIERVAIRLAALSPEAPAREGAIELAKRATRDLSARHGADAPETNGARMVLAALICLPDALTPRHEAPASEGDA